MNEIMVTIYCLAYNHEKYIKKALDSFVMQKTNFEFEVLIHDDASTDHTADIIKEYAKKYSFIHPIYQEKNQYSQGISIGKNYMYPNIKGKYVAFCEGDDYWISENKLQMMVDFLENNQEYTMCCHAYKNVDANTEQEMKIVNTLDAEGDLSVDQVIKYENPTQLATQVFRRNIVVERPDFSYGLGVGDYPLLLNAAVNGKVHYFSDIMAVHRVSSDNSWTVRVYKNPQKQMQHWINMEKYLKIFDEYYSYKYHKGVIARLDYITFKKCLLTADFKRAKKCKSYDTEAGWKRKLLINMGIVFPKMVKKMSAL